MGKARRGGAAAGEAAPLVPTRSRQAREDVEGVNVNTSSIHHTSVTVVGAGVSPPPPPPPHSTTAVRGGVGLPRRIRRPWSYVAASMLFTAVMTLLAVANNETVFGAGGREGLQGGVSGGEAAVGDMPKGTAPLPPIALTIKPGAQVPALVVRTTRGDAVVFGSTIASGEKLSTSTVGEGEASTDAPSSSPSSSSTPVVVHVHNPGNPYSVALTSNPASVDALLTHVQPEGTDFLFVFSGPRADELAAEAEKIFFARVVEVYGRFVVTPGACQDWLHGL
jgi:hypothetical protein